MFKNPFSFEGRIRRLEYGLSNLIGGIIYLILIGFITASGSTAGGDAAGLLILFYIPYLWFIWAQGAKRCHDVGNSGWWQLIPFYALWMLFQDGQPGANEYGDNPKGIQSIGGQTYQGTQRSNTSAGYQGGYSGGHNSQTTNFSSNDSQSKTDGYKEGELYK